MQSALEAQGYDVAVSEYDLLKTRRDKVRNKVRYELPDRLGRGGLAAQARDITQRTIALVREMRPDRVIVIKGDVFLPDFWEALRKHQIPTLVWMYDELRRTQYATRGLPDVDAIASYSAHDTQHIEAQGFRALHLPLFYAPAGKLDPYQSDDVTFIGARYGARQPTLEYLRDHGVDVRAFGRDWSHAFVDRARTWGWQRPDLPASRDVTLAEAHNIMAGSLATLNIHGDQDGFTIRTFEASGVGALQLIDRADVADLYVPGEEILVYESMDHLLELVKRAQVDRQWATSIREAARRRTLADHTIEHRMKDLVSLWA